MNKRILTVITLSFSAALLMLVIFQVNWLARDYRVREEFFKNDVDEALNNTAAKLEKLNPRNTYTKITQRIQGIALKQPNFKGQNNPIGFMINEELSVDSNG